MIKSLHSKIVLFLCLVFIVTSGEVHAQKTVFSDNFNTSQGTIFSTTGKIGTSPWTVTRSGSDFGAKIDGGLLTLTNDATPTNNSRGWVFANVPTDSFGSDYKPVLNQNAGIVSWSFNMRNLRGGNNGFTGDNYGVSYILAGTENTTNTKGVGYAVRFGYGGGETLRLVRYENGLSNQYTLLTSADVGKNNVSIRIEYNPQTENWSIYTRQDPDGAFTDPSTGTPLTLRETKNHSAEPWNLSGRNDLTKSGAFWYASTAPNATAIFDNVKITVALPEITSITPSSKTAATAGFTMTVTGKNFSSANKVNWNGQERTTTYVSPTQLTATITAADIAVSGSANVTVKIGTTISNSKTFTIIPSGAPILTLPNTTLATMQTVQGTASAANTYTLRGDNLTAGATVTAPANFELSSNGSDWSDVLNLPNTGGGLTGQEPQGLTLQARLKANAVAGIYAGNISHASAGAATKFVAVSGKVLALKPTTRATNITFSDITSTTFKINWINGNGSQRLVVVKKATAVNVDPMNGATYEGNAVYKIGSNLGAENYVVYKGIGTSVSLKSLEANTVYHVSVIEFIGADEVENYLTPGTLASTTTKISPSGLQVNAVDTSYKIDFDQTVDGVNSEAFKGEGIRKDVQPGQLDSDSWAFTGFAAGNLGFGENSVAGTSYEMGSSTGNTPATGIYGFNIGTSAENYALGIHPGGADFNSGTITLKVQNKTAVPMTSVNIGYKVYVYNDQASATKIEFSTSATESGPFTGIASLEVNSPEAADINPEWEPHYRVATVSGFSVAPGQYYYIRWNGSSIAGTAAQDEFAIDDIEVIANPSSTFASFAGNVKNFVLGGNAQLSADLSVQDRLEFNGGKLFIKDKTLTIASAVFNESAAGLSGGLTSKIIIKGNRNPFLSFDQTSNATRTLASLNLTGTSLNKVSVTDNLIVNDALILDNLQTLNLGENILSGSLTNITNNGEIQTQNTSDTPFPAEKNWKGTGILHLNSVTVAQKLVAGTYNNLTLRSTGGTVANANITVKGTLHLPSPNASSTVGSLAMGLHTLTMGSDGTNTGLGDVTGIITRNTPVAGKLYTFGHPNSSILFQNTGTLPKTLTAKLTIGEAPYWRTGAVQRQFDIIQTGAADTKTLIRMHYLDTEINSNSESKLVFWVNNLNTTPTLPAGIFEQGRANNNTSENWVEITNADIGLYFQSTPGKVYITLDESEAEVLTWNGITSESFTTSTNWTPTGTPSSQTKIIIPNVAGLNHIPELNSSWEVKSILIESGGILKASTGAQLTIHDGAGAWQNNGTLDPGTSEVVFINPNATIAGKTTFNNITIAPGASLRALEGSSMTVKGAFINYGLMSFALLPNTLEFAGIGKTVPLTGGSAQNGFYSLKFSGSGTTIETNNLNIRGDLTLNELVSFVGKTVNFTGVVDQTIGGTEVIDFNNLTINKASEKVILAQDIKVGGTLTLQSGNIIIGGKNLTLGQSAVAGTPGVNSMIVADGTGKVIRPFTSIGEYFFPIGEMTSNPAYSPIKVNVTAGSFSTNASVSVSVEDKIHPDNHSLQNYISRFWNVTQVGISNAKAIITGTYVEAENLFPQKSMAAGQLDGPFNVESNPWKKVGTLSGTTLLAENVSLTSGQNSVFTGIKGGEFSVEVYGYGGFCQGSPGSSASLEAVTDGGDAPFTYSWSNALPNGKIVNVPTDAVGTITYEITVRDANGFEATDINSPVKVFAPSVGGTISITDPASCSTTLELQGKVGDVLYWQRSTTFDFTDETTLNIGNATSVLTNREIGIIDAPTYFRAVVQNGPCGQVLSNVLTIESNSTTWRGPALGWTNSAPTAANTAIFAADYDIEVGGLTVCNFRVNEGVTLKIKKDSPITVQNDIINYGDIIVENNANLIQVSNTGEYRTDPILNSMATFTVQRKATIKRLDYVYWSSPVADQNLRGFSPGTIITRFLAYDESDDYFKAVFPAEGPTDNPAIKVFSPAKGYAIRARNNQNATTPKDWPGQFVGKPNNGVVNFNLKKDGNGYNLVGNPYPSNILLEGSNSLFSQNTAVIESMAYFWTNVSANEIEGGSGYSQNNYAILNGTGSIAAPGEKGTAEIGVEVPTPTAKIGQGFIVKAKEAGKNQNLVFNNSIRNAGESIFFDKKQKEEKDRFWLSLTTPNQFSTTMLIGYVTSATNGFEYSYDAPLMSLGSDSFFSVLEDRKLGIQGRQYPLNTNDKVALGTNHYVAGDHVISLQKAEGIFANGQNIYLKDKKANIVTNLSAGNYTFAAVEGLTEGRFEIIYENDIVLGTGSSTKDELMVYRDGTDFIVKAASKKISDIEVYDTSGRLMMKLNPNQTEVRIEGQTLINSVYVLKIYQNGKVTTRKIIR